MVAIIFKEKKRKREKEKNMNKKDKNDVDGLVCSFRIRPLKKIKKWKNINWVIEIYQNYKFLRKALGIKGKYAAFTKANLDSDGKIIDKNKNKNKNKNNKKDIDIGRIGMTIDSGIDVVSHEAGHSSLLTISYIQRDKDGKLPEMIEWDEEFLCLLIGNISSDITQGLIERALW